MSKARIAAGFILAHVENRRPKYLLLRSTGHGNWLPPKGHSDKEDTDPLATALRELAEETGITDVTPADGFDFEIEYDVDTKRGQYHKHVHYLLATTSLTSVELSPEHNDHGWFELDDALKKVVFDQLRQVLQAADAHLRSAGLIQ